MGSLEDHGPHAPMGDHLFAEEIALRIAARAVALGADTLVAPVPPFGAADFFAPTAGGLALSPATLGAVLAEVLTRLLAHGLDRIVILNGHGGNAPAIEQATRAVKHADGTLIPCLHLWRLLADAWPRFVGPQAAERLGHGADPVWSVALALRPDLCRPEAIPEPAEPVAVLGLPVSGFGTVRFGEIEVSVPVEIDAVAPSGVAAGDPRLGDAATGQRAVAWLVEQAAALILHLRAQG